MKKSLRGADIPAIGLGTWQMKGRECTDAVERALNMGYRHVDTAAAYENEEEVGRGIKESAIDREDIFVTTKVWRTNLSHDSVISSAEESLRKMDTEYIDLLLIHWPNQEVAVEETLSAMQQLQEDGRVKHIGVSNFTVDLLEEARKHASGIVCNQVEMHPFHQQRELQEYCRENELFLTAYSPLARGRVIENETLQKIGRTYDRTAAQVALRWLIQQDSVLAIPKAVSEQHQRDNLEALEFELAEDDMQRIFDIEPRQKFVNPNFSPW